MLVPGSIAIMVKDANRAMKWYKEKLGFEVRSKEDQWITVSPKGGMVEYHLCDDGPLEPGNTGIAFLTDDAREAERDLRNKGVKITTRTTEEDWGAYCQFADPDGNEFWVSENAETFAERMPRRATGKRTPARGRTTTATGRPRAMGTPRTTRATTGRPAVGRAKPARAPVARKTGKSSRQTRGVRER